MLHILIHPKNEEKKNEFFFWLQNKQTMAQIRLRNSIIYEFMAIDRRDSIAHNKTSIYRHRTKRKKKKKNHNLIIKDPVCALAVLA